MVTLEQVEKLREHANISYDEAKAALENADGDILQALIDLERQGKVTPPQGGGQYKSGSIEVSFNKHKEQNQNGKDHAHYREEEKSAFSRSMRRFFHWLGEVIHKGNINAFIIEKNGSEIMKLPITVLVLLLFFAFWIVVPLMIVGFFFSFRYSFQGPDIRSTRVNDAIDSVADAAEEIKNDIKK
ncbi:MAG TPA: DUF4342 domain-containing protein [Anaerovoracaceae bacterium]|nr:DUF4342 domain-containing protein [Anaerovoracaceae bacterium]